MSDPLKIGIACYPTYGGSGVVATELGIALAEKGHEIHFLSYEQPIRLRSFVGNIIYHEVMVQEYPLFKYPPYALALATQLADVAEKNELDLFHVHYAIPHSVSAFLAREMIEYEKTKIVVTLHGTDITIVGNDPAYKRVTRFAIEQADGVTAVSEWLAGRTRELFETDREIAVIPNFVDLERFDVTPCPEANALAEKGERVLVHVSNFRPVKRVLDLVQAYAQVAKRVKSRLLMVGDGPERAAAQALASDLGVSDRVHFLGSQQAVEKIIPCADLFVLPSWYESFGLAALEAMACGVPVVVSDAGGLPEVVEDGVTGALCPVGDVEALAETMVRVLQDEDRLREMGRAARRHAEEHFALESVLPLYEAYYRKVCGT